MKKAAFNIVTMVLLFLLINPERANAGCKDPVSRTFLRTSGISMTDLSTTDHVSGSTLGTGERVGSEAMQSFTDSIWTWDKTVMNNDETFVPDQPDAFTIQFKNDGSFSGKTDCNSYFGQYEIQENKLVLGPIGSTHMYCENAQEDVFLKHLQEADSYFINDEGLLILQLKFDSGSMIFR